MKHKLTDNWGLKLGSLIFAFFLWIIVTNMNDPVITYRAYDVPVMFVNTNAITDLGKTYEVLDGTDEIDTVTIAARRSVIDSLNMDDVVAVADFNDLSMQDTITIKLSTRKYNSELESISGSIDAVRLNIEELKSKTLALSTITSGTVSDGYMVGSVTADQNQVRISGPASAIDQIVRAEVNVQVTGFTQDIITDVDINLLNEEGNKVISDSISANITTVKVDVELLQTKKINLEFETMGTPADGYEATGVVTSDPASVLVAGRSAVLKNLDKILVGGDTINITGQSGNMYTMVDISDYLPGNVLLADNTFDGNVAVTVYIEPTVEKAITLDVDDIELVNIPEDYKIEIVDPGEYYEAVFVGLKADMDKLSKSGIEVSVDLENILEQKDTVGSLYHANLKFKTDNSELKTKEPVQIWIRLQNT